MKTKALPDLRAVFELLDGSRRRAVQLTVCRELAYCAIYNLFRSAVAGAASDDWLIVNQALSADALQAAQR